jgi:hypothetical protein
MRKPDVGIKNLDYRGASGPGGPAWPSGRSADGNGARGGGCRHLSQPVKHRPRPPWPRKPAGEGHGPDHPAEITLGQIAGQLALRPDAKMMAQIAISDHQGAGHLKTVAAQTAIMPTALALRGTAFATAATACPARGVPASTARPSVLAWPVSRDLPGGIT